MSASDAGESRRYRSGAASTSEKECEGRGRETMVRERETQKADGASERAGTRSIAHMGLTWGAGCEKKMRVTTDRQRRRRRTAVGAGYVRIATEEASSDRRRDGRAGANRLKGRDGVHDDGKVSKKALQRGPSCDEMTEQCERYERKGKRDAKGSAARRSAVFGRLILEWPTWVGR